MLLVKRRLQAWASVWQVPKTLTRCSSTSLSPFFSVPTLPHDTKDAILGLLGQATLIRELTRPRPVECPEPPVPAALMLVSPRHTSWLSDVDFMAALVRQLRRMSIVHGDDPTKFHLLAAVVDALPGIPPDGVPQEGLAFATDHAHYLLPGLWDDTHPSLPDTVASSLNFVARTKVVTHVGRTDLIVTLPLANTLFVTGRRTTLLASEWHIDSTHDHQPKVELSKSAQKRMQSVELGPSETRLRCTLHPLTHPRIVADALGNIISKIKIEGKLSPASEELQRELPIWLQNREKHPSGEKTPGPVAVWALVIPKQHVEGPWNDVIMASYGRVLSTPQISPGTTSVGPNISPGTTRVGTLVQRGCRLVRVLSGGGEWGAKAGLLSLDPQIEYERPSEAESLQSFQSAFQGDAQGDVQAADAVAKPGDMVQFFVEPAPGDIGGYKATQYYREWPQRRCSLGVSDVKQDSGLQEKQLLTYRTKAAPVAYPAFGGCSLEGIYLSGSGVHKTKIDVPGSRVDLLKLLARRVKERIKKKHGMDVN